MRELFFGTPAVILWAILCGVFLFTASYAALVTREVGGLRGLALAVQSLGLAVVCGGFSLLLAKSPVINTQWVGVVISVSFYPTILASLVLVDIFAADHNDHRSVTTITYLWFKRAFSKEREVRRGHSNPG